MFNPDFNLEELYDFIARASLATYAGSGKYSQTTERPKHNELEYSEGDFHYRDSYAGYLKSRGSEYVKYKEEIVWENGYGGGMVEGREYLIEKCFTFLKKALLAKDTMIMSFRGPKSLEDGLWKYIYVQTGKVESFVGREEIFYKGKLVFIHDIVGGVVKEK